MKSPVRVNFPFHPRRRSTAPEPRTPESPTMAASLPPRRASVPVHSRNTSLPPIGRRPLKKFRKYYIGNLSSNNGSTQDQTITSAGYFQSEDSDLKSIRLETQGSNGARGVLLLESPHPNKGLSMPRMFRTISQISAVKSIGNMVSISPNLGYFSSTPYETSGGQTHTPQETLEYQLPLPLDNLIVLANKLSTRRSRRSLHSRTRSWFIDAMWEGLKRLQSLHEIIPRREPVASREDSNVSTDIRGLIDGVMETFGGSLLHFHHKVLKIQQKRDHTMSASQEQKRIVRQEIAEINEDINQTQAKWQEVEQEREQLRRRESLLRKKLSRNQTAY
ncbi:unnamed protein product [Rhizoctonia solani]|uniref:Uncharacterized protein n=1 Tax=Rhizoctonia solani TaxID=456999 RepID=A0A8H3I492_9AGAM|nr:unnamed protein product [Rhizoctonia solani]